MKLKEAREASREALQAITENGLLGKVALEIYCLLFEDGPMTAGEVFARCQARDMGHKLVKGAVSARITELRRKGVLKPIGREKCSYTGNVAITWDVTGRLPTGDGKLEEPIYVKMERMERNTEHLEDENARLRRENEQLRADNASGQFNLTAQVGAVVSS